MKATLCVKGDKIKSVKEVSYQGYVAQYKVAAQYVGPSVYPDYKVYKETTYKSVLSEDQKALIDMVRAAAVKYDFELKVIDVTERRFLNKLSTRLKGIDTFPALVTDRGPRIEGDITEERIKPSLPSKDSISF